MSSFNALKQLNENFGEISNNTLKVLKKIIELEKSTGFFPVVETSVLIFGFSSKKTNKLVVNNIFLNDNFDWALIDRVQTLSAGCKINHDLIFQKIENYETGFFNKKISITKKFIFKLLKNYPEKRVLDLIFEDSQYIVDTMSMFNQLEKHCERDGKDYFSYLPKKPKSMKEIHDKVNKVLIKAGIENFSLEQREDVLKMDNKIILDGKAVIRVPVTHYDLVDLGEDLNFCIGNGTYSYEVRNGRSSIVAIYSNNKPMYGVQFTRYSLKQAYGFGNSIIPKEILFALEDCLTSKPEVPEDFIRISHSFIYGYKYNNENLYIMLSNGGIYMYENVSNETYEGFVKSESMGSYFAKVIKVDHHCERLS
jgi:hypothetical protein